jgi:predicted MFS family arabinose efflux permease
MFFVSIVGFPIIGMTSDYYGFRITFLKVAGILAVVAYCLFLFMEATVVPLIVLGLSYSFFGSIVWPCVAYLVPEANLGIALGILTSI